MSTCDQQIDCCPPTPFDYLIPTELFYNDQQCAVAACPDLSNPTTACIDAGTVASSDGKDQANAIALGQAIAAAKAALDAAHPCDFKNEYWCCISSCNPDHTKSSVFNQVSPCVAGPGQSAASVAAGVVQSDTLDHANQIAKDSIQAQAEAALTCLFHSVEVWWVMTCPDGGDGVCLTSAPSPADNLSIGHVLEGAYSSDVDQGTANALACAQAKELARQGLSKCSIPQVLNGLQWLMPCIPGTIMLNGVICSCNDPIAPQVTIPGTPGQSYNVKLRIRGAIELAYYLGQVVSGTGNFCITGGGYQHDLSDGANLYALDIYDGPPATSFPSKTYYLNNNVLHNKSQTYAVDYQFTITVKTGQILVLRAEAINTTENNADWTGNETIVPVNTGDPPLTGFPPNTQPYVGQFMQMDVVSVTT